MADARRKDRPGGREPTPWLSLAIGGMLILVLVVGYVVNAENGAGDAKSDSSAEIRIGAGAQ